MTSPAVELLVYVVPPVGGFLDVKTADVTSDEQEPAWTIVKYRECLTVFFKMWCITSTV